MHPTLFIPELLWPEPGDQDTLDALACPNLEWLLAHARRERAGPQAAETALASLFGVDDAAFGRLRRLGESGQAPDDGRWLCADPVHLRFHHERIVLADAGAFDVDMAEAEALVRDLNAQFADDGEFHAADARRWYVRLRSDMLSSAPPLSAVAGRRIDGELPAEPNTARLRSWLNEIQMFLHQHPVNARRAESGQPAINSLWLWGGDAMPATPAPCSSLWSDAPLALGFARALSMPANPLPRRATDLLAAGDAGDTPLVVLDALQAPVLYEQGKAWRRQLETLDSDWFAPLRRALGGQIAALTLITPTIYGMLRFEIAGGERWKFWRRPHPLAATIRELAE